MSSVVETSLRLCRLRPKGAFMRFLGRAKRAELERSTRYRLVEMTKEGKKNRLVEMTKEGRIASRKGKREEKEKKTLYLCISVF